MHYGGNLDNQRVSLSVPSCFVVYQYAIAICLAVELPPGSANRYACKDTRRPAAEEREAHDSVPPGLANTHGFGCTSS